MGGLTGTQHSPPLLRSYTTLLESLSHFLKGIFSCPPSPGLSLSLPLAVTVSQKHFIPGLLAPSRQRAARCFPLRSNRTGALVPVPSCHCHPTHLLPFSAKLPQGSLRLLPPLRSHPASFPPRDPIEISLVLPSPAPRWHPIQFPTLLLAFLPALPPGSLSTFPSLASLPLRL